MEFEFQEESFNIIGAAMAVHRYFGPGFTEKVYQDALEIEFQKRNIPYQREVKLHAVYQGVALKTEYIPDFICYDSIVVELKAVKEIEDVFRAQTINYVRVSGKRVGLLLNFGQPSLEKERFIV